MRCSLVLLANLLAVCLFFEEGQSAAVVDATKELILTPFIKSGELDKARARSEDNIDNSKLKTSKPVKSYSGFLTVDEKTNSNLFFWFFPAQENPEKAPVILYVNDAPGLSCLLSIFLETGPFVITENLELMDRNSSWTKFASMLYIDAPVGSGFSFAENDEGFAKSSDDEAKEVYDALVQFFTIFKEFQPLDFHLAGSSYAGSFIPFIANKIDKENANAAVKINLKGFFVNSPFLDISKQGDKFSDLYYSLGLVDETERKDIAALRNDFRTALEKGDQIKALSIVAELLDQKNSRMAKYTGFEELASALDSKAPAEYERFDKFLQTKEIQNYLHVGLHQFLAVNAKTFAFFMKDFLTSHVDAMTELMNKDIKVLLMAPQFNLAVPIEGIREVVNGLKWKGSDDFAKAPRKVWKVQNDVAGYVKQSGSFSFVVLRNAGSHAFYDQPVWTNDLVKRYLQGTGFD
ncbi:unnamed protein product [Allacma fusca]|uniref:Serine carboxypeptidase CPVL n=1 Tax=Allacma fusca TaxID=39272 RepID=A0A8J2NTU7_9HEXA|nr:unnamed protein product [Allacma fusca]